MVRGNKSLGVLATVSVVFLLYFGAPFFIPLFVSLLIAYALSPVVNAVTTLVRHRVIGAAIVMATLLGLFGLAVWAWADDAERLWTEAPAGAKALSSSLQKYVRPGPFNEVKKAAADLESVAQTGKPAPTTPTAPPPASATSQMSLVDVMVKGGKNVALAGAQVISVLFLVFFMLASGDLFKRKLLAIAAERNKKRFTMQVIDEIDAQVRRYLLVLLIANTLVGIGTWLAFTALGVNYAGMWGAIAAVMHTAPYFGPALIAAASLVGGFMQFGEWSRALMVSGASILVAALVGQLFATWLASKQTEMNTTATFIGLLFFGWIWGLWGVLLAIPLLAILKTVCDANEDWKPVAELLGR
jgi:predicted PurR-regulated permease PerM